MYDDKSYGRSLTQVVWKLMFSRLVKLGRIRIQHLKLRFSRKVVIGAGGIEMRGWVAPEKHHTDVCDLASFEKVWSQPVVTHFFTEQEWGHPEPLGALPAARNCARFLVLGGRIRLAIPAGNHPDPEYFRQVRPGGTRDGAADHKLLYTMGSLCVCSGKGD